MRWSVLADALVRRLGPGHERVAAWFHHDRAYLLEHLGDHQRAIADLEQAIALKQKVLPPDHPDIARSYLTLAVLHTWHGDGVPALIAVDRGLEISKRAYGPDNPVSWNALDDRGEVLEVLHRYPEAEHDLRRSIDLLTAFPGNGQVLLGHPLTALGRILLAEGKVREAVATLERALRLREGGEPNPEFVAETRFALARAYRAAGRNRPDALKLATAARETYGRIPGRKKQAEEIGAWLASR
jgi:tetratricopeptide (TPR) repeat protein